MSTPEYPTPESGDDEEHEVSLIVPESTAQELEAIGIVLGSTGVKETVKVLISRYTTDQPDIDEQFTAALAAIREDAPE